MAQLYFPNIFKYILMKLKISYTIIFFIFLNSNNLIAQNNASTSVRSTEKVMIGGKVFYVHTVKKGETLYSIAKAYFVNVDDIVSNNPSINTDLQPGQTLRIPDVPVKQAKSVAPEEGQVLHVVSAGQTLYSISRIYGVPVADIEAVNPELKYDSLQVDQVIKIPIGKNKVQEETKNNYVTHKVVEKETLYSLSRKYGVSQEDIIKFNDPLLKDGLKTGLEIKIFQLIVCL